MFLAMKMLKCKNKKIDDVTFQYPVEEEADENKYENEEFPGSERCSWLALQH